MGFLRVFLAITFYSNMDFVVTFNEVKWSSKMNLLTTGNLIHFIGLKFIYVLHSLNVFKSLSHIKAAKVLFLEIHQRNWKRVSSVAYCL